MDSSVIPSTTGLVQGMPRPRQSVKNATQEVSQQADLLMLILVSINKSACWLSLSPGTIPT